MARFASALGTVILAISVVGFVWLFAGPSPEDLIHGPARPVVQAPIQPAQPVEAPHPVSRPPVSLVQRLGVQPPAAPTATPTLVPLQPTPQVASPVDRIVI